MILKSIFLYPDLVEFSTREKDLLAVRDQTRHICNYLDRRLPTLKFQADGFNRICIIGQTHPHETHINSSSVLAVYIPFDMDACRSVPQSELSDYYAGLLKIGLEKCYTTHKIPRDELLFWLEEMKRDNYRNEWTFKGKTFREHDIRCRLDCSLTIENFTLRLKISRKDIEVFDEVILTTPPDEIAFHHKFKDLFIENGNIVVTTRLPGESLFTIPIPAALSFSTPVDQDQSKG